MDVEVTRIRPPREAAAPAARAPREVPAYLDDDDIGPEPVLGLPAPLPEGERILWQGAPDPIAMTREVLKLRWVVGWFVLLALWRAGGALADGTLADAGRVLATYGIICLVAVSILWACGRAMAKAALYTITTKRVVLRIGVALTLHLQVPFSKIASADLKVNRDGTGTLAFTPLGDAKIGTLNLWPHIRPWAKVATPAFRAIPRAQHVADVFGAAVRGAPIPAERVAPAPAPAAPAGAAMPAE